MKSKSRKRIKIRIKIRRQRKKPRSDPTSLVPRDEFGVQRRFRRAPHRTGDRKSPGYPRSNRLIRSCEPISCCAWNHFSASELSFGIGIRVKRVRFRNADRIGRSIRK